MTRDGDGRSFQRLGLYEGGPLLPGQRGCAALQEGHIAGNSLVDGLVVHVAAVDPDDLCAGAVIGSIGCQRKGTVGVAVFLLGGGHLIARCLAVGALGADQQGFRSDALRLGDGDALRHLQQDAAAGVDTVQCTALSVGGVIRQQIVGVTVQVMAAVPFHYESGRPGQAKLGHQGVKVRGGVIAVGGEHQMSAVFQVGAQGRHLIHEAARRRNVLLRVIDDEQVAVVRDGVRQQVEGADGEVLAFQRVGQGVGEALFTVVRRVVGVELFAAGDAVDGSGELIFAAKGHTVAAGGVVVGVVIIVEVGRRQHGALLPRDEDETAVLSRLHAVLGGEGRVDGGVFRFPLDVAALGGVAVQQLCDDGVLAARLGQIVDGDILRQGVGDVLGAVAEGVEPGFREVELGVLRRDSPDDEVEQDGQHDHQHRDRRGIDAAAYPQTFQRTCALFLKFLHSLPPLSSSGASRCPAP